jgi:DNA replication and repair protein RecF
MYLRTIQLTNFKSYTEASFSFNDNVNGVVGANGSGKTNLLDAIHYLSFGKSCFSAKDVSSVRLGTDFFALHGDFADEESGNTTQVSCVYKNGAKSLKANKKEYDRLSDHVGLFPVVMVSPYDSDIINDGNEVRRKFFDKIISQFDKLYLQHLIHYKKLLLQRNAVLRQQMESHHADLSLLQVIDYQLMENGVQLYERRRQFIEDIRPMFLQHYRQLTRGMEEVDIRYDSALSETRFEEGLAKSFPADAKCGFTTFGVHKDDYDFTIDGQPVKHFGSQGQQKSFSLALRLSQFDYAFAYNKRKPILLLDDIFDKLDRTRITELLNMVGQEHFGQVFISDTDETRVKAILGEHGIAHEIFEIKRQ